MENKTISKPNSEEIEQEQFNSTTQVSNDSETEFKEFVLLENAKTGLKLQIGSSQLSANILADIILLMHNHLGNNSDEKKNVPTGVN